MKYKKKIHEKTLNDTKSIREDAEKIFISLRDNICKNLEEYENKSSKRQEKFQVNRWVGG